MRTASSPSRRGDALERRLLLARRREDARQVERHADARDLVARGAVAERVAALGDLAVHDEDRRVVEVLARELEQQIEDRVALGRLLELGARDVDRDRAATTAERAHAAALGLRATSVRAPPPGGTDGRTGSGGFECGAAGMMLGGRGAPRRMSALRIGGNELEPRGPVGHHALEQALEPAIERHAVVARERLLDAHERRDLLRDGQRERERELLLDVGRERLGDRDGEPVAIDAERREVPLDRDLGRDEPLRLGLGARQLTRRAPAAARATRRRWAGAAPRRAGTPRAGS